MCSTLIPYFADLDDIRQNNTVNNFGNTTRTTNRTSSGNDKRIDKAGLVDHETDPVVSRLLKRYVAV